MSAELALDVNWATPSTVLIALRQLHPIGTQPLYRPRVSEREFYSPWQVRVRGLSDDDVPTGTTRIHSHRLFSHLGQAKLESRRTGFKAA